jgi:hypothetical protein
MKLKGKNYPPGANFAVGADIGYVAIDGMGRIKRAPVGPAITGILPDLISRPQNTPVNTTLATLSVTGGTAPFAYLIVDAAGLAITLAMGNQITNTANPIGTLGDHVIQVQAMDSGGQTKTEPITVTLT